MTALFIPSVKSVIGKNISVVAEAGGDGGWVNVQRPALILELPAFVACVKMRADPSQTPSNVVLSDSAEMSPAKCLASCHDLIRSEGRRYAFIKSGGECYCEASVSNDFYGVPEDQCDAECPDREGYISELTKLSSTGEEAHIVTLGIREKFQYK